MNRAFRVVWPCLAVLLLGPFSSSLRAAPGAAVPTVTLAIAPAAGPYKESDTITLTATVTGATGAVSVEFRTAFFSLGTDATAPYSISLNMPRGHHVLRAIATDSTTPGTSNLITIDVEPVLCMPRADGVPAHSGPPRWFDTTLAADVRERIDDPRWRGSSAVTHGPEDVSGSGVQEHVLFRALQATDSSAVQSLYLSWWVKVAPNPTVSANALDVVIDPKGGNDPVLLHVNLTGSLSSGFSMSGTARTVTLTNITTSAALTPTWLSDVAVWVAPSGPSSWAVNVRIPTTNIYSTVSLPNPFGLAYRVHTSVTVPAGGDYIWSKNPTFTGIAGDCLDARATLPADPTCPGGVSLGVMDVGIDSGGTLGSQISLLSANVFSARPWNFTGAEINPGAGTPQSKIMATFRIANWGTQPDWTSVADPATLWRTIPLPPPTAAPLIAEQSAAVAHGAQAMDLNVTWNMSAAQKRPFQTVAKLEWQDPSLSRTVVSLAPVYYNDYTTDPTTGVPSGTAVGPAGPSAPVNYDWGTTTPGGANADKFAVRWTGTLTPSATGTYTFYTTTSDGVRLTVGTTVVVGQWNDHATTEHSGTIALTAGTPVSVQMDYYKHDRRRVHQCMLVELFGPNLRFQNTSVYRNMNFVNASRFEREADVSVIGLPPFPGGAGRRDVYLFVEARNMPAVQFRGPKPEAPRKDPVPPPQQQPPAQNPDRKKLDPQGGPAVPPENPPPGPQDPGEVLDANPSYVIHAYHDTGVKKLVNGVMTTVLKPQTSFGYVVSHPGELAGWRHALEGAQKIGPNLYKISVQDGHSSAIRTVIEAVEPSNLTLSLHGGYASPHGTLSNTQHGGFSGTLEAEWRISNRVGVEGMVGLSKFPGSGSNSDLTVVRYAANAKVYLLDGPLRPYARLGGGAYAFNPGDTFFGGNIGVGLQYNFSPRCGVELGYDLHEVFRNGGDPRFSTVELGVLYRF